jgi:hypothetical protein
VGVVEKPFVLISICVFQFVLVEPVGDVIVVSV